MGRGKIAGLNYLEPRWVDGRLWQFDADHIGFLWLDTLLDFLLVCAGLARDLSQPTGCLWLPSWYWVSACMCKMRPAVAALIKRKQSHGRMAADSCLLYGVQVELTRIDGEFR